MSEPDVRHFWHGKRVFVTSPTSHLGAWTCLSLKALGAEIFGFGEASIDSANLFDIANLAQKISMTYGDIRDEKSLSDALSFASADVVLHLGEMGFLFQEDRKSPELIAKSVVGTAVLLELLRETGSVRSVVVASSDKVYARPAVAPAQEGSLVAAYEILPTARLCSELVALSYRHSFFNPEKYNKHKVALATVRLSAGFGGGDFALRSFLFESIESLRTGRGMELRNPDSQRAWISVLDQVQGILRVAQALWERGPKLQPTYNMAPRFTATVGDMNQGLIKSWKGETLERMVTSSPGKSIHGVMDGSLAFQDLGWQPVTGLEDMIATAVSWYRAYFDGAVAQETAMQIRDYFTKAD